MSDAHPTPPLGLQVQLIHLLREVAACRASDAGPGRRSVQLDVSTIDAAQDLLAALTLQIPPAKVEGGQLACPHCGYFVGKKLSAQESAKLGWSEFHLVEDTLLTRDVAGLDLRGALLVDDAPRETDYDGHNGRLECPLCARYSLPPEPVSTTDQQPAPHST